MLRLCSLLFFIYSVLQVVIMYICTGYTGMQTDNACVLDIICVGPGGGSPDGLLFPLLVSTEKPCFPKQMWAIFPAEHQPTSNTRARLAHCL